MKFLPEHYVEAASERIEQAEAVFRIGHYSLAMDTAGRAVECILRAYFFRKHGQEAKLEAAHDVLRLFKTCDLETTTVMSREGRRDSAEELERFRRELVADITSVSLIWSNDFRYASETRLRADLRRKNLHRSVKGDFLKFNAQRLIAAARRIVDEGVKTWIRSKKR
jgi:HEPN domain-containing protein